MRNFREINQQNQEEQIDFSETVGFGASEALSSSITQIVLNSIHISSQEFYEALDRPVTSLDMHYFHTSGTRVPGGIKRIRELLALDNTVFQVEKK